MALAAMGANTRAAAPNSPSPRWARSPFALGVASGSPRPDSVVLWTRLATDLNGLPPEILRADYEVRYEIYSDEALRQPVAVGTASALAQRGHSVHVHAKGLQSERPYWYRFTCGNAVSPVGRTRTAPLASAKTQRLRLALASCQHLEQGYFAAHAHIAQQELDLVLFVGDYIYESTRSQVVANDQSRRHVGEPPQTLAQYRQRHAQYKSDAQLQAAHAAHPWVVMWDDHEVVNDYATDRDQRYTEPAVFLARRAAAYQAYLEHMPLVLPEMDAQNFGAVRLYDRLAWGQLADLWTLDCRQYRSHHACPDPYRGGGRIVLGCKELEQPERTMLGAQQEQWLTQGLASSQAAWKLVAQATQIAPSGLDSPLGRTTYTDAWDGYPLARARLLQTVARAGVHDVVTLGGDVHQNLAANLRVHPNDPRSPVVASELVGTSITSGGLREAVLSKVRQSNPDIVHARGDERGYALLDITPSALQCAFQTTAHPALPGAKFGVQARFVVERGVAGVKKA